MKIKNIIPIFTALFVVACSATRNNNSAENLNLRLERAELSFYTELLDGELVDILRDQPVVTAPPTKYRREYTGGVFGYTPGGLDGIRVQPSLTNDVVEQIYITNAPTGSSIIWARTAVETRRGGVAGNVPQKFWRNDVVTKAALVAFILPQPTGANRPTIFTGPTGTEEANIPAEFDLYKSLIPGISVSIITNIGQTSRLIPSYERILNPRNLFPTIPLIEGLLISTNATSLSFRELATSGEGDTIRYFLKEDDRGVQTYDLVN